jgi:clan AA aspartic protease
VIAWSTSIEVGLSDVGPFAPVEALVDTGATYTLLPRAVVAPLGVRSQEREEFILADGRTVEREIAIVVVRHDGRTRPTACVIDDAAPNALLGAVTLEEFGLAADPVNRRLIPAPKYLAWQRPGEVFGGSGMSSPPRALHAKEGPQPLFDSLAFRPPVHPALSGSLTSREEAMPTWAHGVRSIPE